MTREEIREGIAEYLQEHDDATTHFWKDLSESEKDSWRSGADEFMRLLHSKGVVIKVDRELSESCDCCEYNKWDDEGNCIVSGKYEDRCSAWSPEAGYVAVEPLIKEESNVSS